MSVAQIAMLIAVGAPWIAAAVIFALGESRSRARLVTGVLAAVAATAAAVYLGVDVANLGDAPSIYLPLLGIGFGLMADGLGVLFALLASSLWLVTTIYATGYMAHAKDKARFFGFFAICVGSAIGIALSSNLLTLFIFYEALTLATYPLVVHKGTEAAIRGGRTYLKYALTGGVALAVGTIWLHSLGVGSFVSGGSVSAELISSLGSELTVIFALLVAGFGVKAALFPAHGWLPAAMVAPAPVSALLHAVAVVKAGVFGIARVVLDLFGVDGAAYLGLLAPLAALAAFTIVFASVKALTQDDIKKRLAYSTIGQLSYIVLGLALGTPVAIAAACAHLVHHALMKITMFFTAGTLEKELKIFRVSQMNGVGRRMPLTMLAFSVAALGIIGVPPVAGFVSKWGLGIGGLEAGQLWPLGILALSSVLNAVYLMPMIGRAWFGRPNPKLAVPRLGSGRRSGEADHRLVLPLVVTSLAGLAAGPAAIYSWSPASWSAAIAGADLALTVPWRLGAVALDDHGVLFLWVAIVAWSASLIALWRANLPERGRFYTFFLLSALSSVGLAFALDPAIFYACFSVMALSAYGLIVHNGNSDAKRAGRIYLAFTVIAEAMLLVGLLIGSYGAAGFSIVLVESPWRDIGIGLLFAAFGIKIGVLGAHGWMPLAYRASPRGVMVAIGGVVSSAGILGMIRFLPGGAADFEAWGLLLIGIGLVTAFYAALIGCFQREPRHVLAYSSMSQFGIMVIGVGAGMASAESWPLAVSAVAIYMLHHGFAKAALFSGDDYRAVFGSNTLVLAMLGFAGAALAGLPLTSGAVAKTALKESLHMASLSSALEILLPLTAVGTTLLMARFLTLSVASSGAGHIASGRKLGAGVSFGLLIAFTAGFVWLAGYQPISYAALKSLSTATFITLIWPVALAVMIALMMWAMRGSETVRSLSGRIPPGDLWAPMINSMDRFWMAYQESLTVVRPAKSSASLGLGRVDITRSVEKQLLTWRIAAVAIALLLVAVLLMTL